jgi:hypothetical protein
VQVVQVVHYHKRAARCAGIATSAPGTISDQKPNSGLGGLLDDGGMDRSLLYQGTRLVILDGAVFHIVPSFKDACGQATRTSFLKATLFADRDWPDFSIK